jgi:hypothetical protein
MFRPAELLEQPTAPFAKASPSATSSWLWGLLYLGTLVVVAVQVPARIEHAEETLSPRLRREIGSEQLADAAIRFGAYVGLLLFAVALLLIVVLIAHYERRLKGVSALLSATRLAVGPCWTSAAAGRIADITLSGRFSLGFAAALVVSVAITCALFARRTSRTERLPTVSAIAVSAALSVLS